MAEPQHKSRDKIVEWGWGGCTASEQVKVENISENGSSVFFIWRLGILFADYSGHWCLGITTILLPDI